VMLAVSKYLAPQYRVAPGETEEITLEVLGADVERFAELDRLLEPFGARLTRVESDRLVYRLNASPEQLRSQLALARLQEVPADEIDAQPVDTGLPANDADAPPVDDGNASPIDAAAPLQEPDQPAVRQLSQPDQGQVLRYRW